MNKRILIFGGYPIVNPMHGGQKRLRAIVDEYSKAGNSVRYCAVYSNRFYPEASRTDIAVSAETEEKILADPQLADYYVGEAISADPAVKRRVESLIREFGPDIIQFEQSYPYLGLEGLLGELNYQNKLVYSSQNIEYVMKKPILISVGETEVSKLAIVRIEQLEKKLATSCDLILAVSREDADFYKEHGAKKVIIAPNGISPTKLDPTEVSKLESELDRHNVARLALFVGSAHQPNWVGFKQMIGIKMGFLPSNVKIGVAGGISDYFQQTVKLGTSIAETTFWNRVMPFGRVDEPLLAALLHRANVILLPITSGGGSNLKTAEAILAAKPIVATNYAFRGYERLRGLPNVHITDDPADFRAKLLSCLDEDPLPLDSAQKELVKTVTWDYCLRPALEGISAL